MASQQEIADFLKRAQTKLNETSAGVFFQRNNARLLPSFDRGSEDSDEKNSKEGTNRIIITAMNSERDRLLPKSYRSHFFHHKNLSWEKRLAVVPFVKSGKSLQLC
jgi:hypothetical protein